MRGLKIYAEISHHRNDQLTGQFLAIATMTISVVGSSSVCRLLRISRMQVIVYWKLREGSPKTTIIQLCRETRFHTVVQYGSKCLALLSKFEYSTETKNFLCLFFVDNSSLWHCSYPRNPRRIGDGHLWFAWSGQPVSAYPEIDDANSKRTLLY